jgi:hypothetical protein|tara:strand:- start:229 stop:522 length:294 start_codon:yes stop_codon:yes gene_type:complete
MSNTLHDKDGNLEYYSKQRVVRMVHAIGNFIDYRDNTFRDSDNPDYARVLLKKIEEIKELVPEAIREFNLTPYFRLSEKELGELEKKCKRVLEEESF